MKVLPARAGADQLVQLGLDGAAVPVLGVLDQEHHQEDDNRGAGVDDQLPGVGEAEERARNRLGRRHQEAKGGGHRSAGSLG